MKNMPNKFKRWHKISLTVVLLLLAGTWYLFVYDPPYSGPITKSAQTLVFAHRGGGFYAPDNSMMGAEA